MEKIDFYKKLNDVRNECLAEILKMVNASEDNQVNVPFYLCEDEEDERFVDELREDYEGEFDVEEVDRFSYDNTDFEHLTYYGELIKSRALQVNNRGVMCIQEGGESIEQVVFRDITTHGLISIYEAIVNN